jgi:adenylate kinase
MLREAVREQTDYGKTAKGYMDKGDLVPNDIVNGIVRERFEKDDVKKGFILDGYPRSVNQAEALDGILKTQNIKLSHVVSVVLSDEIIVKRLSQRRSCPKCGEIYHLIAKPPKKKGECDECGSGLILRNDDKEEVILHRLKVYRENTQTLLDRYEEQGLIIESDGEVSLDDLRDHLKELFC